MAAEVDSVEQQILVVWHMFTTASVHSELVP